MRAVVWMGASLLALGACSDGGGDDGDGSPDNLAGYDAEFAELVADADGLAPTDPSTLPTTGSADYEGVIRMAADPDAPAPPNPMSGTLDMALDFETGAITGEATDFVTYGDDPDEAVSMDGSLVVAGAITRDPNASDAMTADIDGSVQVNADSGGDEGSYRVDGVLRGDLLGEDGQVVGGNVSGTVYTEDSPYSAELDGDFIAAR